MKGSMDLCPMPPRNTSNNGECPPICHQLAPRLIKIPLILCYIITFSTSVWFWMLLTAMHAPTITTIIENLPWRCHLCLLLRLLTVYLQIPVALMLCFFHIIHSVSLYRNFFYLHSRYFLFFVWLMLFIFVCLKTVMLK